MTRKIGVRELKNRASEIMYKVQKSGAEYIVTLRGEPVAVLASFPQESEAGLRQAQREEALQKLDTLAEQIAQSWRSPESALEMFNRAAADVTSEDLDKRESLLGGFASRAGE
jgi:prevent-host-death family protein